MRLGEDRYYHSWLRWNGDRWGGSQSEHHHPGIWPSALCNGDSPNGEKFTVRADSVACVSSAPGSQNGPMFLTDKSSVSKNSTPLAPGQQTPGTISLPATWSDRRSLHHLGTGTLGIRHDWSLVFIELRSHTRQHQTVNNFLDLIKMIVTHCASQKFVLMNK